MLSVWSRKCQLSPRRSAYPHHVTQLCVTDTSLIGTSLISRRSTVSLVLEQGCQKVGKNRVTVLHGKASHDKTKVFEYPQASISVGSNSITTAKTTPRLQEEQFVTTLKKHVSIILQF